MPVLILDDERFDRHRLARLCSGLGYPCAISNAQSLDQFAQELELQSYDLMLLDYALPDGTGLEALEMVHLSPRNLNTPMVMISGQGTQSVVDKAKSRGCISYLAKADLSRETFAKAVANALGAPPAPHVFAKERYDAGEVEQLLALCSTSCARDIKPMVSRLMRQLRDMRARGEMNDPLSLKAIEQNVSGVWPPPS